jgi:DNA polymerase elongation subunit (family B)
MNAQKTRVLVQKCVLAAFGHDNFEDIDLVYPKTPVSKKLALELVGYLFDHSLSDVKEANKDADGASALTIDALFDRMKEFGSGDGGEGEGEGGDVDEDEGKPKPAWLNKKPITAAIIDTKSTIIDILLADGQPRDEKIQIINDAITLLFPRLEGDKVTFIGSTFLRYGETQPYLNHCLVLGSCDPVDGAVIESTATEGQLLLRWADLIQTENPDIIIGYNIFGFDYEFMFRRAQENLIERRFLLLSRKIGDLCAKENRENPRELLMESTKINLASGEYDLRFPKIAGRLQIDMLAYFRRDFNLSSYKLDDVTGEFISDDIKRVEFLEGGAGPVTELYSQNLMGLGVGDYIHIGFVGFTADYYKDGQKFKVIDIVRGREVEEVVKGKPAMVSYNVIIIGGHEDVRGSGKSVKWSMAKDDVTPQDIFRLANGSAADRAVVAKYCIQDCNLVHHLMNKIDVITGYVEMSRICSVPISFLVFRGQGIKLTSYVAKKCREKDTLMPDIEKSGDMYGYEGAIVLPPKCAMYVDNPVACVDYSSLYPSSMISQNYSHDSKVWTKEYNLAGELVGTTGERDKAGRFIYDGLPGYHYIDIEFDTFAYIRKTKTSAAVKTKVGKKVCRWAQFPEDKKGIMPSILQELLKARKDTRAMIKGEKDPFMQNILDKRQLGYKVTANSLYGQCGSRTSTFYEKDVAASTTATGRMMIIYAKRIIEEVYGDRVYSTALHGPVRTRAEYVYGDSVASYTPIYVRVDGDTDLVCTAEELAERYGSGGWVPCLEEGKQEKEVCEMGRLVESWTEAGWTRVRRVIRHALAPHKKMIRVITHTGVVDVTDDHSLLRPDGVEVSPKEVGVGSCLLHAVPESCTPEERKQACDAFLRYLGDPRVFTRNPDAIYEVNGIYGFVDYADHLEAAYMWHLATNSGFGVRLCSSPRVNEIRLIVFDRAHPLYRRRTATNAYHPVHVNDDAGTVLEMREIDYSGYVYDLTTENHHFGAGIGNMIVHNTDSVFFTFNLENPETGEKIRGKPALEMTIEIAQDAADLCTQWLKPPMELSYEKTLMPFYLLAKKRYVGNLYETDPNKGKMKFMGLSLKRRDNCDYLKDVYGGILNILMDPKAHSGELGTSPIRSAIDFLDESLNKLVDGKVGMDKLTITKALRSDYKNPNQIGHKVLADRIGKRDPGNKPKPGDRMKFVFVVNETPKALMGDKIETPEYILSEGLTIDYSHYVTNQLMKPLQQLLGLAIEQIWEYQGKRGAIKEYKKDIQGLWNEYGDDLELFMKQKEKYCSKKVKVLLFDKVLARIHNTKHKIQTITSFFGPKH